MLDLVVFGLGVGRTPLVLLRLRLEDAVAVLVVVKLHLKSFHVLLQLLVVVGVHQVHVKDALGLPRHLGLRDPEGFLVGELLLQFRDLDLEESDLLPLDVTVQSETVDLIDQILLVLLSEPLIDLGEFLGLRQVVLHVAILRPAGPL